MPLHDPNKPPLTVEGRISISRQQGDGEEPMMSIEITDHTSRTSVCRMRLSMADFALALTGQGEIPGPLTIYAGAPWGKRLEVKTVPVLIPNPLNYRYRGEHAPDPAFTLDLRMALKDIEIDGWQANNVADPGHGIWCLMGLSRWVEVEGD